MTKRKRYGAEVKAKVAVEAIREKRRTAERATQYDIHPPMIAGCCRPLPTALLCYLPTIVSGV